MTCTALPGISSIQYVQCQKLPDFITAKAVSGMKPSVTGTKTEIAFEGQPLCESTLEYDNNTVAEKVTLRFRTMKVLPVLKHLAFIVQTVNGEKYVIGTKEKPYPVIERERSTGTPDGDAALLEYKVTFSAKIALVEVDRLLDNGYGLVDDTIIDIQIPFS